MIFLKMGKHSDSPVSSFQVVDAWHILQFKRKTETFLKVQVYGFGGRCHKIIDVYMDL